MKPHPDTPCSAFDELYCDVRRGADGVMSFRFVAPRGFETVHRDCPPRQRGKRADGLWQSTCYEAFLRGPDSDNYYELNFAHGRRWAAYSFVSYRTGMANAEISEPEFCDKNLNSRLDIRTDWKWKDFRDLPQDAPWRIAISAVIEDSNGAKSYWALAHPPGKPDFHHADGFVLDVSEEG